MLLQKEREQVVKYSQDMLNQHLTVGTGGNISCFDAETGYMCITPSGRDYLTMKPEDIVVMDLNGNKIEGEFKPSSEYPMHSAIYKARPDGRGIVHTHSMYCTILSTLNMKIPACLVTMLVAGADIPCAKFHPIGSKGLAASAVKALENRDCTLLGNHGMITVADSLTKAFHYAEYAEFAAEVYYKAKLLGEPYILSESEIYYELDSFRGHAELDF